MGPPRTLVQAACLPRIQAFGNLDPNQASACTWGPGSSQCGTATVGPTGTPIFQETALPCHKGSSFSSPCCLQDALQCAHMGWSQARGNGALEQPPPWPHCPAHERGLGPATQISAPHWNLVCMVRYAAFAPAGAPQPTTFCQTVVPSVPNYYLEAAECPQRPELLAGCLPGLM